MKRTVFLTVLATLLFAGFLFAQNNPPRINGIIWKPDDISLTYVEGNGTINGFFIGRFEITQAQWKEIMGYNPNDNMKTKGDNLPVSFVSWDDVQKFLKKLNEQTGRNYRLPTEAEWVYAAKGGNISEGYEYAGSNNIDEVAWYSKNSEVHAYPVGSKKPNELGIFDMTGNIAEWCEDCGNKKCSKRAIRGGFSTLFASYSRVETRNYYATCSNRNPFHGFRVVLPY